MELLVVRHAVAEERDAFAKTGSDDAERPLTPAGRRKFERGARGLRRAAPSIDLLATSALTRRHSAAGSAASPARKWNARGCTRSTIRSRR
jgi:phosphohistidine phosphatase